MGPSQETDMDSRRNTGMVTNHVGSTREGNVFSHVSPLLNGGGGGGGARAKVRYEACPPPLQNHEPPDLTALLDHKPSDRIPLPCPMSHLPPPPPPLTS